MSIWNILITSLQWRHNGWGGVSNHEPHDCLLSHLSRCRSYKPLNLRVTGPLWGNSPVTGEFHPQRASTAENVPMWWRHHGHTMYINVDQVKLFHDTNCVLLHYLLHASDLEWKHMGPWIPFELRIFKFISKINTMNISGEKSIKILPTDIPND